MTSQECSITAFVGAQLAARGGGGLWLESDTQEINPARLSVLCFQAILNSFVFHKVTCNLLRSFIDLNAPARSSQ